MANRWGIPKDVEEIVKERDLKCIYCGIEFDKNNKSRKAKQSWEHIVNDIRLNNTDNIALCCMSCNASKGSKLLIDWLRSDYCLKNNITEKTVAEVVTKAINNPPKLK